MDDVERKSRQRKALREVLHAIFEQSTNLIGSDFANIAADQIEHDFPQDSNGVTFQFTISNHALGKVPFSNHQHEALEALLKDDYADFA